MSEVKPAAIVNAKIAAIRSMTAAGYRLIQVSGKTPVASNWPDTKHGVFGEKELAGTNYGVALDADDLVLDVDPRNFAPGVNSLAELIKVIGPLKTFIVKTGGGGLHAYLKKPADFPIKGKLKDFPGIDVRTLGGQVVGPGSVHPDTGREYVIGMGTPFDVTNAPEALLALLKKEPQNFETKGTGAYKNDSGTQALFVSYLKTDAPTSGSYVVACRARDLALPPQTALDLMMAYWNPRRMKPRTEPEMKERVAHAYTYAKGALGAAHVDAAGFTPVEMPPADPLGLKEDIISWDTGLNGLPRKTFVNLLTYLRLPGKGLHKIFGHNEFTGQIVFTNPAPWHKGLVPANRAVSDHDLKLLKGHLAVKHGFEMQVGTIEEAVTITAHANKFHPVREYLKSLVWDKTPRLDTWLIDYCGVEDTPYTRACARKVLCAAVMRVMRPGIKFDTALVLEGEQGIGKSAVCKILGGEWTGDFTINTHDKDTIQLMQGKWIIELAELEFTKRTETDALKAFISRQTDNARLAYGRLAVEFPRQSIFIATKNPEADGTYLKDDTGNRRWWPVVLRPRGGQVDFVGLKAARNQLFAEAVARVSGKGGEKLYMDTIELKDAAKDVVSERHAEHPWTERVACWLAEDKRDFLTARDVFIDALGGIDKQLDRRTTTSIAGIMRTLGWGPGFKRVGEGHISRGYRKTHAPKDLLDGLL